MRVLLILIATLSLSNGWASAEPRTREFEFTYAATVTGAVPGQPVRVWLPVPPNTTEQTVRVVSRDLPAEAAEAKEPKYGNGILSFEAKANAAGEVPMKVVYHVRRTEVCDEAADSTAAEQLAIFLKPDAKVPIGGKPLTLIRGRAMPADELQRARVLYDVVDDAMEYRKDKPGWGTGDAVWACDSRFGNCTDFHSVFISLARTLKIPAKFEIGFGLPEKRGGGDVAGYHCWAKFKPAGHGWVPVDVSEANRHPEKRDYFFGHLCENRVAFSTGRDLVLVPAQSGAPVNFFVYPYAEVDGRAVPAENVKKAFSYRDIEPSPQ